MECLRPIAKAPVDDARRFPLANFVETYIELQGFEEAEYESLLAEEDNQEVAEMELTWADKIELRGIEKGMQEVLLEQMEERFGSLSDRIRQRIKAINSLDELRRLGRRVMSARSWEEMELP